MSQASQSEGAAGGSQAGPYNEASNMFMAAVDLSNLTIVQKGVINSVRVFESEITSVPLSGPQVKEAAAETFAPATLFHSDVVALPSFYREFRRFLDRYGASLTQHSSHRAIMTIATDLYEDQEDVNAATEMAKAIVMAGRRTSPQNLDRQTGENSSAVRSTNQIGGSAGNGLGDKTAHNIAMRLKERDKKFSGDLGESWAEYVADYEQISRDYNLSVSKKLQYMHNLFRDDAKRFYLNNVDGYATSFKQAVEMIGNEYNSPVRQNRVKNYLKSLRLSQFVKEGKGESEALSKLYQVITKLEPQAPKSHRGNAHRVEFLRNAVIGSEWAKDPLSRIAPENLTFLELFSELESALQLHKETELAKLLDEKIDMNLQDTVVEGTLYSGQGRYIRKNSFTSYGNAKGRRYLPQNKRPNFNPLTIAGCFNCDDPGHTMSQCPKPIDATKAAMRKMDYYARKGGKKDNSVHMVLLDLCQQLDEPPGDPSDDIAENTEDNDREIFEELVNEYTTHVMSSIKQKDPDCTESQDFPLRG